MDGLAAPGAGVDLFVEDNWMRHMDYLKTFNGSVKMQFEYGDSKLVKEKLSGTRHVITGFFPISLLQFGSEQEVKDRLKNSLTFWPREAAISLDLTKVCSRWRAIPLKTCTC